MGILSRFQEIMSANMNSWLDGLEAKNAEKLIDEKLRKSRENLAQVQKETASVMANESNAKRQLDDITAEIKKYENAAMNALKAGKEDDARKLLTTKQQKESVLAGVQQNYEQAHADAQHMQDMFRKLTEDIQLLETRASMIKGKLATAKARETMNKMTAGTQIGAGLADFDRLEANADKRLDTAQAMSKLGQQTQEGDELLKQYGSGASGSVEDELAAMKAKLSGGNSEG